MKVYTFYDHAWLCEVHINFWGFISKKKKKIAFTLKEILS